MCLTNFPPWLNLILSITVNTFLLASSCYLMAKAIIISGGDDIIASTAYPTTGIIFLSVILIIYFLMVFVNLYGIYYLDREHYLYAFFQMGLAIIVFITAITVTSTKYAISTETSLNDTSFMMEKYNTYSNDNRYNRFTNELQYRFNCCGTYGPSYWTNWKQLENKFPSSCCGQPNNGSKPTNCSENELVNLNGCVDKYADYLKKQQIPNFAYEAFFFVGMVILSILTFFLGISLYQYEPQFPI